MGYTHFFTLKNPIKPADWARVKTIAGRIIQAAIADGIALDVDSGDSDVHLNGVGENAHETFFLHPSHLGFNFCKTAAKPYDIVVVAILAAIHTETKGVYFEIRSDGDAKDWVDGVALAQGALGYPIENPIVDKVEGALPL